MLVCDEEEVKFTLSSKYLVGADGARSLVRKFAEGQMVRRRRRCGGGAGASSSAEIEEETSTAEDSEGPLRQEDFHSLLNVHFKAPSVGRALLEDLKLTGMMKSHGSGYYGPRLTQER